VKDERTEWVGTPAVDVMEVIRVSFLRGDGVAGSPVRRVVGFYTMGGVLIREIDPVHPDKLPPEWPRDA
jgi:hypothetical protein